MMKIELIDDRDRAPECPKLSDLDINEKEEYAGHGLSSAALSEVWDSKAVVRPHLLFIHSHYRHRNPGLAEVLQRCSDVEIVVLQFSGEKGVELEACDLRRRWRELLISLAGTTLRGDRLRQAVRDFFRPLSDVQKTRLCMERVMFALSNAYFNAASTRIEVGELEVGEVDAVLDELRAADFQKRAIRWAISAAADSSVTFDPSEYRAAFAALRTLFPPEQ